VECEHNQPVSFLFAWSWNKGYELRCLRVKELHDTSNHCSNSLETHSTILFFLRIGIVSPPLHLARRLTEEHCHVTARNANLATKKSIPLPPERSWLLAVRLWSWHWQRQLRLNSNRISQQASLREMAEIGTGLTRNVYEWWLRNWNGRMEKKICVYVCITTERTYVRCAQCTGSPAVGAAARRARRRRRRRGGGRRGWRSLGSRRRGGRRGGGGSRRAQRQRRGHLLLSPPSRSGLGSPNGSGELGEVCVRSVCSFTQISGLY
jgi:hypothetical protein